VMRAMWEDGPGGSAIRPPSFGSSWRTVPLPSALPALGRRSTTDIPGACKDRSLHGLLPSAPEPFQISRVGPILADGEQHLPSAAVEIAGSRASDLSWAQAPSLPASNESANRLILTSEPPTLQPRATTGPNSSAQAHCRREDGAPSLPRWPGEGAGKIEN
jgi:hypothetical protein